MKEGKLRKFNEGLSTIVNDTVLATSLFILGRISDLTTTYLGVSHYGTKIETNLLTRKAMEEHGIIEGLLTQELKYSLPAILGSYLLNRLLKNIGPENHVKAGNVLLLYPLGVSFIYNAFHNINVLLN